jgi:hypothetical protein
MGDAADQPPDAIAELRLKLREHKRKLKERVVRVDSASLSRW